MRLARTLSSLCVACVVIPFIGAGPATQPAAPVNENEQLRQRIAQLEAEVADLRAKLERTSKSPAIKSGLTLTDELRIDYVPAPSREPTPPWPMVTGRLSSVKTGGASTISTMPAGAGQLKRPAGDSIDDRPKPDKRP